MNTPIGMSAIKISFQNLRRLLIIAPAQYEQIEQIGKACLGELRSCPWSLHNQPIQRTGIVIEGHPQITRLDSAGLAVGATARHFREVTAAAPGGAEQWEQPGQ